MEDLNLAPNCIAVIPARGGSKRIPRKNIRMFGGKPMIAWSIEAAKASGLFSKVIVSTDDEEIMAVSKQWGAEVPFVRPGVLADDFTGTREVFIHSIEEAATAALKPDYICFIYATAPLLMPTDLVRGLVQLRETGAEFAYAVSAFPAPIQRALRILPSGHVQMIQPDFRFTRSQDLEEAYFDAAQFYWGKPASFLDRGKKMHSEISAAVVLPNFRVVDIDTEADWEKAELLFEAYRKMKPEAPAVGTKDALSISPGKV